MGRSLRWLARPSAQRGPIGWRMVAALGASTAASRARWAATGAAFGVCFPVLAFGVRATQVGFEPARAMFMTDPLLWIIATAPLFLGVFAFLGGVQHDRVRAMTQGLEVRVEERTRQLDDALYRTRLILNAAGDGFALIDYHGRRRGEVSEAARIWFGDPESLPFGRWLFGDESGERELFEDGLVQLVDGHLPFDLIVGQMPSRIVRRDKVFVVEYRAASDDGRPVLMVVVRDITAEEHATTQRRRQSELQAVVAALLRDPNGFRRFCAETERLIESVCDPESPAERLRGLHTLKGSAAVVGFEGLSRVVHDLESTATDEGWSERESRLLRHAWKVACESVEGYSSLFDGRTVAVDRRELFALCERIDRGTDPLELRCQLEQWTLTPVRQLLSALAEHTQRVGSRLGRKPRVEQVVGDVRLDADTTAPFWQSLVHVVRNAVDHGIEPPEARRAVGKDPRGTIALRSWMEGEAVLVSIADDGRGIDWQCVSAKARSLGWIVRSEEALVEALFHDGFTTRSDATELSGRGIGLSAVRRACEQFGVEYSVRSQLGRGTEWTFRLRPQATVCGCCPPSAGQRPSGARV